MDNALTVASLEERAIELARRGEFGAEGRAVNEEIARRSPANQGAWTRLARCCLELGQLDEAAAALDAALQVNPQNTIARNLHVEIARRRAASVEPPVVRRRASTAGRTTGAARPQGRASRRPGAALPSAGIGRAEFMTLAHLPPAAAAESLSGRLDGLVTALNDRPFASRVVEARNRAAQAGARLFRRGTIQAGPHGHIYVVQQGGRWEPQLTVALYAAAQFGRDTLAAGLGFDLTPGAADDRSDAGRERAIRYFEAFQREVSATWRVHLVDWIRANAAFLQRGSEPPATDRLPADTVSELIAVRNPADAGRIVLARGLFADRGEDVGVLTEGPRLIRWIEQTFNDLLPLWATVYRAVR